MKMLCLLVMIALLAGCGDPPSTKEQDARQSDLGPGEKIAIFPVDPYQWRNDSACYVSKDVFDPQQVSQPLPEALKWQKPRRFAGFLNATFEGSSFEDAKRNENPDRLGERRYQTQIYYDDGRINFGFPYRTYWVVFIGREALCNSQRPEDAEFERPSSPNLVIADRFETVTRVH